MLFKLLNYNIPSHRSNVTIASGATLDAAQNVMLRATANDPATNGNAFADKAAQVTVDGAVKGQTVAAVATATNSYKDDLSFVNRAADVVSGLFGTFSFNACADAARVNTQAAVSVGAGARIEATTNNNSLYSENRKDAAGNLIFDKGVTLNAIARNEITVGAETAEIKFSNALDSEYFPGTAIVTAEAANSASVSVAGEIKSAGDVKLKADATANVVSEANVDTKSLIKDEAAAGTLANFSFAYTGGSNNSSVTVADTAKLTEIGGNFAAAALSLGKYGASASTMNNAAAKVNMAVGILEFDSDAAVAISADVKAAGNISAAASDTVTSLKTVAKKTPYNNVASFWKMLASTENAIARKIREKMQGGVDKLLHKVPGFNNTEDNGYKKLLGKFDAAAGIAVADSNHRASVSIGKNAKLDAGQDANLSANTTIKDVVQKGIATSVVANPQSANEYQDALGILVSNVTADSSVTVGNGSRVTGQNVSLASDSEVQYNRVNNLIKAFNTTTDGLIDIWTNDPKNTASDETKAAIRAEYEALKKEAAELDAKIDSSGTIVFTGDGLVSDDTTMQAANQFLNKAVAFWDKVKSYPVDTVDYILGYYYDAINFTNYGTYCNYQTNAAAASAAQNAKFAAALGLAVTQLKTNSAAIIGQGANIAAKDNLNAAADAKSISVGFAGEVGNLFAPMNNTGSHGGATIAYHGSDTAATVLAAQNAVLTGSGVGLNADSRTTDVSAVFSSDVAQSGLNVTGMASVVDGASDAIISLSDKARITATGASDYAAAAGLAKAGETNIAAKNNAVIVNLAGGLCVGDANVGTAIAVTDYGLNTYAVVGENAANSDFSLNGTTVTLKNDEEFSGAADATYTYLDESSLDAADKIANTKKKAAARAQQNAGLHYAKNPQTNEEYKTNQKITDLLGSAPEPNDPPSAKGEISAEKLNVAANTSGVINTVGAAGALSLDGGAKKAMDKVRGIYAKGANYLAFPIENGTADLDQYLKKKNAAPTGDKDKSLAGGKTTAKNYSLSAVGSIAANNLGGNTAAIIDGAKILTAAKGGAAGEIRLTSGENLFSGAWAGAAAINFITEKQGQASVAVTGAAGVNAITRDVVSAMTNSEIIDNSAANTAAATQKINLTAKKSDTAAAAGFGLAAAKTTGAAVGASASLSLNQNTSDTLAYFHNTNRTGGTDKNAAISLTAQSSDINAAGGANVALAVGKNSAAVGAGTAISLNLLDNDVKAGLSGGQWTEIDSLAIGSAARNTVVGAALGASVAASSNSTAVAADAALALNDLKSTVAGSIDGAAITTAGKQAVAVSAGDGGAANNDYKDYLAKRRLDLTGESYAAAAAQADTSKANGTSPSEDEKAVAKKVADNSDNSGDYKSALNGFANSDGTTIIGAAIGLDLAKGGNSIGAGAGVAISNLQTNHLAAIKNSQITAKSIESAAENNAVSVNAALGAGASGFIATAGAVSWQLDENATAATIDKSALTADKLTLLAKDSSTAVNAVGQLGFSAGSKSIVGAGIAVGVHDLNNETTTAVKNTSISGINGASVAIGATDAAHNYSIAAGVDTAGTAALGGSIAINTGGSNTVAAFDGDTDASPTKKKLNKIKSLDISAVDKSVAVAVAGGLQAAAKAAAGAAVAYNDIGGAGMNSASAAQKTAARLSDAEIAWTNGGNLTVAANDESQITTVAAGIGLAGQTFAADAANATSLINKAVEADVDNITLSGGSTADVAVSAINDSQISNAATGIGVAFSETAGIGAGIAVSRINQKTGAAIEKSDFSAVHSLTNYAAATPNILNIAIAGGASGGLGLDASLDLSFINNDVKSSFNASKVNALGNVGIVSQSDETINNYAGTIGGGSVGIGATVAVSSLTGGTITEVKDSEIDAAGDENKPLNINSRLADGAIKEAPLSSQTFSASLRKKRQAENFAGFIADASATHTIQSDLASAGGGLYAAANFLVNSNDIGGATKTTIANTDINKNIGQSAAGNVRLCAEDYSLSEEFLAAASLAVNVEGSGALSAAAGVTQTERTAAVEVTGRNASDKAAINAADLLVKATAQSGSAIGVFGLAGSAFVSGAISGGGNIVKNNTLVNFQNVAAAAKNAEISAYHRSYVGTSTADLAGAIGGIAFSVGDQNSAAKTIVKVENSTVEAEGTAKITAADEAKSDQYITTAAGGAAGSGTSVGLIDIADETAANIINSTVRAENITAEATHDAELNFVDTTAAAGGAAVSVGVFVAGLDSQTQTNISNSTLTASKAIDIAATESRSVKEIATGAAAGGLAVPVNVMVTNIGALLAENDYVESAATANEKEKSAGELAQQTINDVKNKDGNFKITDTFKDYLTADDLANNRTALDAKLYTDNAGGTGKAAIKTKIADSTLTAGGAANIAATAATGAESYNSTGAISGAATAVGVSSFTVNNNLAAELSGSTVKGKTIGISAAAGNKGSGLYQEIIQGTLSAESVTVNTAVSEAKGSADILLAGTKLDAESDITIAAANSLQNKAEVFAVNASLIGVGTNYAKAQNDGSATIAIDNSRGGSNFSSQSGAINIKAEKSDASITKATGITPVNIVGTGNVLARAKTSGRAAVDVLGGGASFAAATINITALNNPAVDVYADNINTLGGIAVNVCNSEAAADLESQINIAAANKFAADRVNIAAQLGEKDKTTVKADTNACAVGVVGVGVNHATVKANGDISVNVGSEIYTGKAGAANATELAISGESNLTSRANTTETLVNLGVNAAANAKASVKETNNVTVAAGGAANGSGVKSLTLFANGTSDAYATAQGNAFGLINIAPYAADAQVSVSGDATAKLSGAWNTANNIAVAAQRNDVLDTHADGNTGGLIDVSGVYSSIKATGATTAALDAATIKAQKIDAAATNTAKIGQREAAETADAMGGSIAEGNYSSSTDEYSRTAAVNIKHTTVTTDGSQAYSAKNDLAIKNIINNSTSNVGGYSGDSARNIINTGSAVNLDAASNLRVNDFQNALKKVNAVTLAASDDISLITAAQSNVTGIISGGSANAYSDISRRNAVNVSGQILSYGDINLFAGKDADGVKSRLDFEQFAGNYVNAPIPIPVIGCEYKIVESNQANISGSAAAGRDVNIFANNGRNTIRTKSTTYTWYTGEDDDVRMSTPLSSDGAIADHFTKENQTVIDGSLRSGYGNDIAINISGTAVPYDSLLADGTKGSVSYTVDSSDAARAAAIKNAIAYDDRYDYGNALYSRYMELTKLCNEYSEDAAALALYAAERDYVYNLMREKGLITAAADANGKPYETIATSYLINAVFLPNISLTSGHINIDSGATTGKGKIDEGSSPSIAIQNTSDAYLKIGSLTVDGDGAGKINIANDYRGGDLMIRPDKKALNESDFSADEWAALDKATAKYTPITDIEVTGSIKNTAGSVAIENKSGSVILSGAGSAISAKSVSLSAKDSVYQGYVSGIVNIGAAPEIAYADWAKNLYNQVPANHSLAQTKLPETAPGGIVSGGNIYISASDINVNGTIQSGYGVYQATVSDADLKAAMARPANKKVIVNGATMYKVNDGGAKRQADGSYIYEVQIYYDPAADSLVAENISADGGKIYLAGRISSTGDGKIFAADGGANITIDNKTDKPLNVSRLGNSGAEGLISLTDLNVNKRFDYTSSGVKTYDLDGSLSNSAANSSEYKPLHGLRYMWTDGEDTSTTYLYQTVATTTWWGLDDQGKVDTQQLIDYEKTNSPQTTTNDNGDPKAPGTVIAVGDNPTFNLYPYVLTRTDNVYSEERSEPVTWVEKSGFIGWKKQYYTQWTVKTGTSTTYLNSVMADYPIAINFLGSDAGATAISSRGAVNLNGNISGNNSNATLTITADNGAISQAAGTNLFFDRVTMRGKDGVNDLNIVSLPDDKSAFGKSNTVLLNLISGSGDISANITGGIAGGEATKANARLDYIMAWDGGIDIKADGDIAQVSAQIPIYYNDELNLSAGGALDAAGEAQGSGGIVSLAADGNIDFAENSRFDLRLGKIASASGDVKITAKGNIVNGVDEGGETFDQNRLVKLWQDGGIIYGGMNSLYEKRRAADLAQYTAETTAAFDNYQTLTTYYANDPTAEKSAGYLALAKRFSGCNSAAEYLAKDSQYQMLSARAEYNYTADQLLYAVKLGIVNNHAYADDTNIAANISGKNIGLTAGGGIGANGSETVIDLDHLTADDLKALSKARSGEVIWDEANKKARITSTIPVGINACGTVNASAKNDIYLAARSKEIGGNAATSEDSGLTLRLETISSANGSIRLAAPKGIYNVNTADIAATAANVSAPSGTVYLAGGFADIGASDKYLNVVTGTGKTISAAADGGIYLSSLGRDMTLGAISAGTGSGQTVGLDAGRAAIYQSTDAATGGDVAYIAGDTVNLKAAGGIGTDSAAIRIKTGATVNADAGEKDICLYGVKSAKGNLTLGKIATSGHFSAASETGIGQAAADAISAESIGLSAADTIKIDGSLTAEGDISQRSAKGDIINAGIVQSRRGDIFQIASSGHIVNYGDLLAADDDGFGSYIPNGSVTQEAMLVKNMGKIIAKNFYSNVLDGNIGLATPHGRVTLYRKGDILSCRPGFHIKLFWPAEQPFHLRYADDGIRTDALLLDIDDYYRIYPKRRSVVEEMLLLSKHEQALTQLDNYYKANDQYAYFGFYDAFGLIDTSAVDNT